MLRMRKSQRDFLTALKTAATSNEKKTLSFSELQNITLQKRCKNVPKSTFLHRFSLPTTVQTDCNHDVIRV